MDRITDLDLKSVLSPSYISSEDEEEDAGNDLGFANESLRSVVESMR